MKYPNYLNSANLYINGELAIEDMECPEPAVKLSIDNNRIGFESFPSALAQVLYDGNSEFWKLTDEDQQGMRGWFEFKSGLKTAVFMVRSEVSDDLTNISEKRPDDLIATAWYNVLNHFIQRIPLKRVEVPRKPTSQIEAEQNFKNGMNVSYPINSGERFRGMIIRKTRRLLVAPTDSLAVEILSENRDSNGHRQRGMFCPIEDLEREGRLI